MTSVKFFVGVSVNREEKMIRRISALFCKQQKRSEHIAYHRYKKFDVLTWQWIVSALMELLGSIEVSVI